MILSWENSHANFFKIVLIFLSTITFSYSEIVIGYAGASVNRPSKEILVELDKIKAIALANNIEISFKQLPWKRALLLLEKGMIDGVINASFKEDRAQYALYPMSDNQLDSSKRLNDGSSYFIYRSKTSHSIWNGTAFIGKDLKIGVMEKFAVIEDLKKHSNIQIKTFVKNNDIVRNLLHNQLDGYASSERYMKQLMELYPKLQNSFVKDPLAIRKKEYFLIFSKISYPNKSSDMKKIWDGLKKYNER